MHTHERQRTIVGLVLSSHPFMSWEGHTRAVRLEQQTLFTVESSHQLYITFIMVWRHRPLIPALGDRGRVRFKVSLSNRVTFKRPAWAI